MKTKPASRDEAWSDPEDAPRLTKSFFAQAEILEGEKVIRPARPPRSASLPLDADVVEALRAEGDDWKAKANAALRAAFGKRG